MASPSLSPSLSLLFDINETLGALYIGNILVGFFSGVTTFQTYIYYVRNPKDNIALKIAIFILWVIDMAHLVVLSHAFYGYTVSNFGNIPQLFQIRWGINAIVILTDISDCMVRGIYTYRIWILSGRKHLLAVMVVFISLVVFVLGIYFSARAIEIGNFLGLESISWVLYVCLSTIAAADVVIAAILCVLLKRHHTASKRTQSIVNSLIIYTINSSALTSLFALACLVTYAIMPHNLVFLAIYVIIPKLYFNSLLAMLNSRKGLREHNNGIVSIPLSQTSSARTRRLTGNPVYTDRTYVGGIHVETTTDKMYDQQYREPLASQSYHDKQDHRSDSDHEPESCHAI